VTERDREPAGKPDGAPVAAASTLRWDPRAPRFAAEDGKVAPLSSSECVFLAGGSQPHVMTMQVLQALDLCREFATLDEHVERILSSVPGLAGKRADVVRVLEGLVARRLLVRDADYLERLRDARRTHPAPLRAVFIRACDRPDRLAHLLASLAAYERRFAARRRYVLIDDSALAANAAEQREMLRRFGADNGCAVACIGNAAVDSLADALIRARPRTRATVRSALLRDGHAQAQRFGGGRSRNLALLLSAGARLVLLDDDLRLPLRRPEGSVREFDPDPDAPLATRFFASIDEALVAGEPTEEDPLDLHLAACGRSFGETIGDQYPLPRDALRGRTLQQLGGLAADARVLTTHHGSCGSARTQSTLWLYHALDPVGREQFWEDPGAYRRNVDAHHVVHAAERARVFDVPGFTPFALDNSALLPCTNPVGRAEDSLAGALTRLCRPDGVAMELPLAIGHVQESLRARFPITREAPPPRVNDFLREFVRLQFGQLRAEDPAQRLALAADIMRDLAHASVAHRVDHLREYRRFVHADVIDRLQRQFEALPHAPDYWQADVRAIVQANARALLASGASPRLAEWPDDLDAAGCAAALSAELDAMADLCEHWPAWWQFAAEQGEGLLEALGRA
jgi:hypothetical protein